MGAGTMFHRWRETTRQSVMEPDRFFVFVRVLPSLVNRLPHGMLSLAVVLLMGSGATLVLRALIAVASRTSGLNRVRACFVAAAAPGLTGALMGCGLVYAMISW